MNILVINPNTSTAMTNTIAAAAQSVTTAKITTVQPDDGPASIEGYYDEAFAVPGVIDEINKHPDADAVVIACFDDTGLHAARCLCKVPVVGIGEAAFHMATLVCSKFAVVTTLARSVAALENNLCQYGLDKKCTQVLAADVAVLDLEDAKSAARKHISATIKTAISGGADGIVLGCAGMTNLTGELQKQHNIVVIDGLVSAVKLAEGLVAIGATTSKTAAYAQPLAKEYSGELKKFAPQK